jgi:hypothetical protein
MRNQAVPPRPGNGSTAEVSCGALKHEDQEMLPRPRNGTNEWSQGRGMGPRSSATLLVITSKVL